MRCLKFSFGVMKKQPVPRMPSHSAKVKFEKSMSFLWVPSWFFSHLYSSRYSRR